MNQIFVVSDGTGGTAKRALNAALAQFEGADVQIIERPNIRKKEQIESVAKEAAKADGFIIYTMVSNNLRVEGFCIIEIIKPG